jgi:hypothetical protein
LDNEKKYNKVNQRLKDKIDDLKERVKDLEEENENYY